MVQKRLHCLILGPQQAPEERQLGQRSVSPAVVHAVDSDRAVHGTSSQCYFVWMEREGAHGTDPVAHEAFVETDHIEVVTACCMDTYVLVSRATEKKKYITFEASLFCILFNHSFYN